MRVIIVGDTHIGAVFGLGGANGSGGNTRIDDYEKTLNDIISYAIDTRADALVQTGDVFDVRNPDPEHIAIVNKCMKRLSDAGITSLWLMGNHDYRRSGDVWTSALSGLAAKDYPNTRILLKPEVITIEAKEEKANLILMPFRDRRMYGNKTCAEDSRAYEDEANFLIESCDNGALSILIGHNFFYEGTYNHYGGTEVLIKPENIKCDMVAMGHFHQFKVIKKDYPIAFYTGSMEKLNFGDSDIDKFFIDYDIGKKKVSVKKSTVRRLLDHHINIEHADYSNLSEVVKSESKMINVKDAVVRLKFSVKDTLATSINRQTVRDILYENGAFYVSKIMIDPIRKRTNKDFDILNKKTDIEMFESFLMNQDLDDEMKKSILVEAKKVIS